MAPVSAYVPVAGSNSCAFADVAPCWVMSPPIPPAIRTFPSSSRVVVDQKVGIVGDGASEMAPVAGS
jgi:hypothetical protein